MSHVPKKKRREEARFPSHYDMPVTKVDKVKTTVGEFKTVVFNAGKDWRGKNEYEIEILYPNSDECGTTTKKFSSVPEAISYGLRAVKEAVQRKADEAKPKKKKKKTKKTPHEVAEELGWTLEWHQEEGAWADFVDESVTSLDDVEEVLYVVLKDKDGKVLESLGGVVFMKGSSTRQNQEYGSSVEDELIEEALAKKNS